MLLGGRTGLPPLGLLPSHFLARLPEVLYLLCYLVFSIPELLVWFAPVIVELAGIEGVVQHGADGTLGEGFAVGRAPPAGIVAEPPQRVCDSYRNAAAEEIGDETDELGIGEMLMSEMGDDLAYHLCDEVESPGSVVCLCGCAVE